MRVEYVGKFQQLFGVARETRKLGKNQPVDMAALNVFQHSLGVWIVPYRLAAHGIQSVQLNYHPLLVLSVIPSALFVMFGAVALHLPVGADAHPDADALLV